MSNVVLSYSPNDFFYVKFSEQNNNSILGNTDCEPLKPYENWDVSCNKDNYNVNTINKINCNLKELCKNKEKAEKLQTIQNNHNGSDQNYLDTNETFNTAFIKNVNLGIGMIILIGLFYKMRNI